MKEKNKKNNKYLKEIKTKQKTNNYVAEKREKPEFDDQVEGRNAVLELLESGKDINKIFVETVGTIKKCDIDAINEAVDLFFDQDEPTDLIQIFVANTIQILNQPDLLVDVLGLSVLINEIIINHQLDDFNPNLWKMNHHHFFSIDYRDYLDEDENQDAYN